MRQYFIRRALLIIPTVLGVTLLITLLLQILQGDIADQIFAESATFNQELTKEKIKDDLGINDKILGSRFLGIFKQWGEWVGGVAHGDFGEYFRSRKSVGGELQDRIPVTLELAGLALFFSLLIALPIGVLSAIRQDTSKGLRERTIVVRHAIKNAFIPVFSLIGVQIAILVSGSVVLERIFGLPGLGLMLIEGVSQREYVAVQGVLLVVAVLVVFTNFLVDMVYSMLDPRIRYA